MARTACARNLLCKPAHQSDSEGRSSMKTNKLLRAAVLAVAIGVAIASFIGDTVMSQPTTAPGVGVPFLHGFFNGRTARSELASLERADAWLNSPPLTASALRGKVVLVDFWTYTCINWLRTLPYVRAWAEKYKDQGLVVIGVHAPEFSFEKNLMNVGRAVKDLRVDYPVAVDNDHVIWRAFSNQYWPALYFVDAQGRVRHHHFGEGSYEQSEMIIQKLLAEAGASEVSRELSMVDGSGIEAAADWRNLRSGENYVGYERTQNFASPGGAALDQPRIYSLPTRLRLNDWALSGEWTVKREATVLNKAVDVSRTGFTPAICISSWERQSQAPRCGFAYSWMGSRRVLLTGSTSTTKASAQLPSSDSISSSANPCPSPIGNSKSSSSTPAWRPLHSRLVERADPSAPESSGTTMLRECHDVPGIVITYAARLPQHLCRRGRHHCCRPACCDRTCGRSTQQDEAGRSAQNQARRKHFVRITEAGRGRCLECRLCRGRPKQWTPGISSARLALRHTLLCRCGAAAGVGGLSCDRPLSARLWHDALSFQRHASERSAVGNCCRHD